MAQTKRIIVCLLILQLVCWAAEAAPKKGKGPVSEDQLEKQLKTKVKAAPKSKVRKARSDAAMKLHSKLLLVVGGLANKSNPEIPIDIIAAAEAALPVVQGKDIVPMLNNALPFILQEAVNLTTPAEQTVVVLNGIVSNTTSETSKIPLKALADKIASSPATTNAILSKVLGSPDILGGVVRTMVTTLTGNEVSVAVATGVAPVLGGILASTPGTGGNTKA